jgi:hypothetical protein
MDQVTKPLLWLACLSLLVAVGACGPNPETVRSTLVEPCEMLSSDDIQGVQGEAFTSSKPDKRKNGPFLVSNCFYTLPTYSKSVSVELMRPVVSGDPAASIDFWDKRFHNADAEADEEEAERAEASKNSPAASRDAEEEKQHARPQPVSGLGDEAFWAGSQISGSLYIRRNSDIIRISIGGPDDQSVKIEKAKSLAERVLSRLYTH